MKYIHPAYIPDPEGVVPGIVHRGASELLDSIPFGHSVVAVPGGEPYSEYVYDPEFLISGSRFFKVVTMEWDGKLRPKWIGASVGIDYELSKQAQ